MPSFLAETYLSRLRASRVRDREGRAREAARELTKRGLPVRFIRSIFIPQDEICFFVFEAVSADAVGAACARAALRFERVVEAVESPPGAGRSAKSRTPARRRGERRAT